MFDMTHSYAWHDSLICVTWFIHACDLIHSCVWHDSFMCVTWLIDVCDMILSYAWHNSFICVTWFICMYEARHTYAWVILVTLPNNSSPGHCYRLDSLIRLIDESDSSIVQVFGETLAIRSRATEIRKRRMSKRKAGQIHDLDVARFLQQLKVSRPFLDT